MGILGSRALLLALLVWPAQGQTVPEHSRPAWDQCQQLSQKLCTLAWSAHPPMGHVVSDALGPQKSLSLLSKAAGRLLLGGSWRPESHQR